jgi:hypothetical protein
MKSPGARGALVLLATLAVGGSARAQQPMGCRTGSTASDYVMWFDDVTSSMVEATAIQRDLLDLRAELRPLFGNDQTSLASDTCASSLRLKPLRDHSLEGMQQLLDRFVVMAILSGDRHLEYYILPYLLGEPSPPRLVIEGTCACGSRQPADGVDQTQRIQAYAYAALALYEIRRQESHRDACGAHRSEILVQRAISKVDDLDAHNLPEDVPNRALVGHLRSRCLILEQLISELGPSSPTCGMPAESARMARRVSAADVCGARR